MASSVAVAPLPAPPARLRVLVVEHHSSFGRCLVRYLERAGHWVEWAREGETARTVLEENCFEALITDVYLPDGTAFRTWPERPALPPLVVTMSAFDLGPGVLPPQARSWPHLVKPFEVEQLEGILQEFALHRRQAADLVQKECVAPGEERAIPTVAAIILRQCAQRRRTGELTLEEFQARVARIRKEELAPRRMGVAVRIFDDDGIRFVFRDLRTDRPCATMDCGG